MKREGMPTQRLEEKRVEKCMGEGETEGERKKEHMHAGEKERESALAPPFMFFPPPGPALRKLG